MSEIKATLRIPTADPYAYIEIESNVASAEEAVGNYIEAMRLVKGERGLPDKEYDQFVQAILEGEPNHIEQLEQLNERQNWAMQVIKRALNRIEYKEKKNLPPVLKNNE